MDNTLRHALMFLILFAMFLFIFYPINRPYKAFDSPIIGYMVVPKNNFREPVLSLEITPESNYPGGSFTGRFIVENTKQPLFDYTIKMWAPCEPDFRPVTEWQSSNQEWDNSRITFSGIADYRMAVGYYYVLPFTYNQCLYRWSIVTPGNNKEARAPPILVPGEDMELIFALESNRNAHYGTYTINYIDSFSFAGRSKIRFNN